MQQQEQDVFHSMCTCLPVGHCIPESQHSRVPTVSLPSRVTGAGTPMLALGAVCRAHGSWEKFRHTLTVPSHAAQP